MTRVAILASGTGSNTKSLIEYFLRNSEIEITAVGTNRKTAGVIEIAESFGVATFHFNKAQMAEGELLAKLYSLNIDWILLSGFLLKIPLEIIDAYDNRILNIHPSLLPKHGGKGMYGMNVHNSVFESDDDKSGMTIHKVTEDYDDGDVVFQVQVDISQCESAEEIASKVLALEHHYYPRIAEAIIND